MSKLNFSEDTHRRYNILTGEWVLVSPHRTKRPWQGKIEEIPIEKRPSYDFKCYLCPGNVRANGLINPDYTFTYAFDNDFSALQKESFLGEYSNELLLAKGEKGIGRVICFSSNHSLTLPEMKENEIIKVIDLWQKEYETLGNLPYVNHVQIFENKGSIMGCSNPHPHGQIWAQNSLPMEIMKKSTHQREYFKKNGTSLLGDYLQQELELGERILIESKHFVSVIPFWATWAFETMIIPRRHMQHIGQMTESEKVDFGKMLKALTIKMDNIFEVSFPYSAGIHQSPTDGNSHKEWHWHMSFYPPLLRSATIKKFMVGYEMFGEPQRDITAEMAAKRINNLSEIHYKIQQNR